MWISENTDIANSSECIIIRLVTANGKIIQSTACDFWSTRNTLSVITCSGLNLALSYTCPSVRERKRGRGGGKEKRATDDIRHRSLSLVILAVAHLCTFTNYRGSSAQTHRAHSFRKNDDSYFSWGFSCLAEMRVLSGRRMGNGIMFSPHCSRSEPLQLKCSNL